MNPGLPPQDLDAEAAVLSAVLIESSGLTQLDFLKPEHFYAEAHRQIFAACLALKAEGRPVDIVQVGTWLKNRERIAQVGGMGYLTEILNAAPAISNVGAYGRTVFEKWRIRRICDWCNRVNAEARSDYGDAQAFMGRVESECRELAQSVAEAGGERILDVEKRKLRKLGEDASAGKSGGGVMTGFKGLDERMGGLKGGWQVVIAARPGMGKSILAKDWAESMARSGYWVPFFGLEMPNEDQAARTISSGAGVDMGHIQAVHKLTPGDWQKLATYVSKAPDRPLFLFDDPSLTPSSLAARVRRMKLDAERAGAQLGAVFVDYLQLMKSEAGSKSREQEVSGISRALKLLAMELKVPVVAMSQLNRESEKDAKPRRPRLADLRESGAIEQDADVVLFIHRESYYSKEPVRGDDIAEIIIAKGRNVAKETVKVRFDGALSKFHPEEIRE